MQILPRDYLLTRDKLAFAVVDHGIEEGRITCFLRYHQNQSNAWVKLSSHQANALLAKEYPHYLFQSKSRDTIIHGVPLDFIESHKSATAAIESLLTTDAQTPVRHQAIEALKYLLQIGIPNRHLGLSGSLLLGAETSSSDIDLVCYDESSFQRARHCFASGAGPFDQLSINQWQNAFRRRGAAMSFESFLWHEQRKHNKAMVGSHKVDISLVGASSAADHEIWHKLSTVQSAARVIDDQKAFHTPARWRVSHPTISELITFSATFTGHARTGEWVEFKGSLEENIRGARRVILGQSREANDAVFRVHPSNE